MTKAKCKKFDLTGKEIEEIMIDCGEESSANTQLIKDYIVALRRNARQWSANTKGRSESQHSGQKPHKQKGTGNARQGFLGAPQYKGGGRVFGPKPKFDQHVRINKKERRAAIKMLLVEKMKEGNLVFIKADFDKHFSEPKTKNANLLFDTLRAGAKRVLCFGVAGDDIGQFNFKLSLRNIPFTSFVVASNVNGYDVMVNQKIFVLDSALAEFEALLRG